MKPEATPLVETAAAGTDIRRRHLHILTDSREQTPLVFPASYVDIMGDEWTISTETRALPNGTGIDYTVAGLEHIIGVSRKAHGDFIGSIVQPPKEVRARLESEGREPDVFGAQMRVLAKLPYPVLLIEATPEQLLKGTRHSAFNGKSALGKALALHCRHRMAVLMVPRARAAAAVLERMIWAAKYLAPKVTRKRKAKA